MHFQEQKFTQRSLLRSFGCLQMAEEYTVIVELLRKLIKTSGSGRKLTATT